MSDFLHFSTLQKHICSLLIKMLSGEIMLTGVDKGCRKRYFKIDQHLARHFVYYVGYLSSHPPFQCSQIITPFLKSMISINQEKGL